MTWDDALISALVPFALALIYAATRLLSSVRTPPRKRKRRFKAKKQDPG